MNMRSVLNLLDLRYTVAHLAVMLRREELKANQNRDTLFLR